MVANLPCRRCYNTTVQYTSTHHGVGYVLCNACAGNVSLGYEHVKATFGMIQKAKHDHLEATLKKYKEFNYIFEQNGQVFNPFLTQTAVGYMKRHHQFLENIRKQQPMLESFIKKSIEQTQPQIEKQVLTIIAHQAEALSKNIRSKVESLNDKKIKAAERYRDEKRLEMSKLSVTADDENPQGRSDSQLLVYDNEQVAEMVASLQKKIKKLRDRASILSELIKIGENISTELFRDKVERVKEELKLDISKIGSETGQINNESMVIVDE